MTPPSAQTEWRKDRNKNICPHCKKGKNSKDNGGNSKCFHCDSCPYVECHYTAWEIDELLASERTRLLSVENHESTAWCECGDALETKPIMKKLDKPTDFGTGRGLVSEIIDHYEYYCFGCDETYKLVRQSILSEMEKGGDK